MKQETAHLMISSKYSGLLRYHNNNNNNNNNSNDKINETKIITNITMITFKR